MNVFTKSSKIDNTTHYIVQECIGNTINEAMRKERLYNKIQNSSYLTRVIKLLFFKIKLCYKINKDYRGFYNQVYRGILYVQ